MSLHFEPDGLSSGFNSSCEFMVPMISAAEPNCTRRSIRQFVKMPTPVRSGSLCFIRIKKSECVGSSWTNQGALECFEII